MLLLFDGDCGFCTRAVTHMRTGAVFTANPWQEAAIERYGITETAAQRSVWLIDDDDVVVASGASAFAVLLAGSPRRSWRAAGMTISLPGARAIATIVYRLVARFRHKLPGGTVACAVPTERP